MESGSCLHPGREAVGGNRLISTPSGTIPAWLGVTSNIPGASPNLIPATLPVSRQGLDWGQDRCNQPLCHTSAAR
ncbi:protein of unknown function [Acidithiobacillus ferrivorans]|uniref:Uncharacterized protein n=1 Tax=Acidithiobacillus ferrivorans TaxID=160808 RepID=A0ABY1MVB0_9PROT|nr:hypothetical protein [Acidithiobacillus sp. MC6.1]SMH67762.1 protein of unknown function [Acidithiobacillus ferrivorans]